MARTVTLLDLRTQAKQRADMVNSSFVSDAEWNNYINAGAAELYDLLVGAFEEYFITSTTVSTIAGTDTYALPTDFYKLMGVDLLIDSQNNAVTLRPFVFSERNNYVFTPTWNAVGLAYLRYHVQGANIRFVPVPSSPERIRVWYIPEVNVMTGDTDVIEGVNGWEEYVIVDAVIRALQKEESDVSVFLAEKQALKRRIEEMANNRDAGAPIKVGDASKNLPYEFFAFGEYR